jgi:hypothetical protein
MKKLIYFALAIFTAMIGWQKHIIETGHGSVFWTFIDFWIWPWAWVKWLFGHEVNWTLIKYTFSFLLS